MTIQDLKDNRSEIINFINNRGYDLNFAMHIAVDVCGNCDSIDELFMEMEQYCKSVKETNNARILGRLEQIEIENN